MWIGYVIFSRASRSISSIRPAPKSGACPVPAPGAGEEAALVTLPLLLLPPTQEEHEGAIWEALDLT